MNASTVKYSRTPLIQMLVTQTGMALWVYLSRILQN